MKLSEIQEQLNKLERMKADLETDAIVKVWREYYQLSDEQKKLLRQDWDHYFHSVRSTKAYRRYQAQGEAWGKNKMDLVKGYAQKAREQLTAGEWEVIKPALVDPVTLENNQTVIRYRWVISELNKLKKSGGDYAAFSF